MRDVHVVKLGGVYERWGREPKTAGVQMEREPPVLLDRVRILDVVREDRTGRALVLYEHLDGPHRHSRCVCSPAEAAIKFRPAVAEVGAEEAIQSPPPPAGRAVDYTEKGNPH